MKLIDTHTHIYDEAFDDDRDAVVQRALDSGIERMLCPAIDSSSHRSLFELCARFPDRCLPMMGLHPTHVNDNPDWESELALVEKYLSAPPVERFYAVGEIGLDLYWSKDFLAEQERVFERQIELALHYGLPIVVHTRNAWPQMVAMLQRFSGRGLRGVMHSFSGSYSDYLAVKECGDFMFGISGPVTYKKSELPDIVAEIPLEYIVLETDSPYLPPVPYRGKRNESSFLAHICTKVADIKGLRAIDVAAATTANACRMFGIDS